MKRVLFSVAILAASVCAADEITTSNVLGILPVTSSAKRTIVSVPWCALSATDDAAIQVSNLVKTANLSVGDTLHYVNPSGKYNTWRLTEGSGGVKYWASVTEVTEQQLGDTPASDVTTVARGNAIMLIRNGKLSDPFYLYGQVGTAATVSSAIVAGTDSVPAYSLIASPKPAAWDVNDGATWSNVGANDRIFVYGNDGITIELVWNTDTSKWCYIEDVFTELGGQRIRTGTKMTKYEDDIPAGQGAWYVSYGGSPTLTWNEIPHK